MLASRRVFILNASRTPIGSFGGSLASQSAPQLGAAAIRAVLEKSKNDKVQLSEEVQEVFMGNVLSAGIGQAPARQAVLKAGLPVGVEATTINKVCASGMKAVMLAYNSIALGQRCTMVAGGMESMSSVPFYVPRRMRLGNQTLVDGMVHDGLWDPYNNVHMGTVAERHAKKQGITRSEMDEYAVTSYRRALDAWKSGKFGSQMAVLCKPENSKDNTVLTQDEEPQRVNFERIPTLAPAFHKEGSVTAANSSKLSDGAAALLLMEQGRAAQLELNPLAEIIACADAAADPMDFPIAPSLAIPMALKQAGLKTSDISLWEINEAFAAVAIANQKILQIDPEKLNIAGGAVALGHPIGCSGARIIVTLTHLLKSGEYGCASVCNGGGAASAIIIRRL